MRRELGHSALAWDTKEIATLQDSFTVSFTVNYTWVDREVILALFGPEFLLAFDFGGLYQPGWIWT